jgi:NAD(P)-dependent dehydrogenase (short-subunit alcohol dehydrogenase family)
MNAASAAVVAFGRALALEIKPVRVNIIAPGVVNSGIWNDTERDNLKQWATNILPVKHLGDPTELAQAYFSVLTNTYMTGSVSVVYGGLMLI